MRTTLLSIGAIAAATALAAAQTPVPASVSTAARAACRIVRSPSLPRAITSFGACRSGGWVYVFGGHIGRAHDHTRDNVVGAFQRLNLTDGASWQTLPDGTPLQGTALAAGADGRIWRVGGMTARNAPGAEPDLHSTASVACFDPRRDTWEEATPLPEPRSSHDAIVAGDRLVVAGGWKLAGGGDGEWLRTVWSADLREQPLVWTRLPDLDHDRRAGALASLGDRLVLLGGMGSAGLLASVRVLEPGATAWTPAPDLPGTAFGTAAIGMGSIDQRLYATVAEGRLLAWDGTSNAWTDVAQLATPRFFHRLVAGDGGSLLAIGGAGRGGHTRSIERIDIAETTAPFVTETVIPAPSRVAYRQALVVADNQLFAFGGNRGTGTDRFAADQFADDVWRVDLLTQSATRASSLPMPAQSMAAVSCGGSGDHLLLGGLGVADGEVKSLLGVFRWKQRTRELQRLPDLPMPRTQCEVVHHGGKLWLLGGTDFVPDADGGTTKGDTRPVLVADTKAAEPTFTPSGIALPRARRSFGSAVIGDTLVLIGGLGDGFTHAGPTDVFDFATQQWSEADTPVAWVSPQVAVIGDRAYVACGGTMKGQRFTEDRSLWSWHRDEGWRLVIDELPFAVRNVQMVALRNRLLFWSANDPAGDRIVIRTLEPDRAVHVPETAMHR